MTRLFGIVFSFLLLANTAFASGSEKPYINTELQTERQYYTDIAIGGYDPVAYFTQSAAVLGMPEYSYDFEDAIWYFASAEHRDMFASDPERYAPQFGGYCAYAVSQGGTAPVNPDLFTIHNDRLYLNLSESVQRRWLRDIERFIRLGEANWPDVLQE